MPATKLKLTNGLKNAPKPRYISEPGYVAKMNAQIKALMVELNSIIKQFEDVTPEVMIEALRPTFEKSQVYVPVQTGDLKRSGYLEQVSGGKNPTVEMGYAKGGNPRYAMYVHEMLSIPRKPPTRAKYLERAIMEDLAQIEARLARSYADFAQFNAQIGGADNEYGY